MAAESAQVSPPIGGFCKEHTLGAHRQAGSQSAAGKQLSCVGPPQSPRADCRVRPGFNVSGGVGFDS
jgi:hypothetical protein